MATLEAFLPRAGVRGPRLETTTLACTAFLLVIAFVVLYPVLLLLINSFEVSLPRSGLAYGFANWRAAVTDPGISTALVNTLKVSITEHVISIPLALGIAWLLARTDVPGARRLEFLFWLSYFLPTLVLTAGWILLADPNYGLLNQLLKQLQFVTSPPLNIYSFWGIVFIHIMGIGLGAKVMLLVPAFRNMDASFEEAARVTGAGVLGTVTRIVIPAIAPAVLIVVLLSLIRSFEAFEIELVLGTPIRFQVYSTKIYALINQSPVNYGAATALSMFILLTTLPLILLQLWVSRRRSYTTLTGRTRLALTRLHAWRWPAAAGVLLIAALGTLLPVGFLLLGSFMGLFGYFNAREVWTLRHWSEVLGNPSFLGSVMNTIVLGTGTAVAAVVICSLMAYVTVRTRFGGRWAFDVLSWVPFTIPGIILGLAYLLFVLRTPFLTPFYGSMAVLVIVSTLWVMTTAMQLLKGTMLQLGAELEEVAKTLGSSWWHSFRRIVVPLMGPSLVIAAVMSFAVAAREVSVIIPVISSRTQPLAVLQLGYLLAGNQSSAAVVGTITVAITVAAALLVRALGARAGLRT